LPRLVNPETGKVHNVSPHRLRDAFAVNAVKTDDSGDGLRILQVACPPKIGPLWMRDSCRITTGGNRENKEVFRGTGIPNSQRS